MSLNPSKTVGELVSENPDAARIFEKAGIDYCCGGQNTLGDACRQAQMPLEEIAQMLDEAASARTPADRVWTNALLAELISHIVSQHHAYVRQGIPRLQALAGKVVEAHGGRHPELPAVANAFGAVAEEMTQHMMKEERMLFPYIVDMEKASRNEGSWPRAPFGTVQNPVRMMMMEHDSAGGTMRGIRELASDYVPPTDACASYRALLDGLSAFEADLHQHVHLENNILFPRAIELEEQ